jgi:hypothetical protein
MKKTGSHNTNFVMIAGNTFFNSYYFTRQVKPSENTCPGLYP